MIMTSDPDRNHWAEGFKSNPTAVSNRAHATLQSAWLLTFELPRRSPCAERAKLAVYDKESST